MNKFAFLCAIAASMSSVLLGYDVSVMSGAAIFIKEDFKISDVKVEILVGIINLYSVVGAAVAGKTSDWIGRRYTMVVAGVIFFVAAFLMGFATNYGFLMFGRFIAGIGVGYALTIAPVYITEVSPTSARGFLTSFPEVCINFGVFLGYVSNFAFRKLPTHLAWRIMLGISVIPSTFLILIILVMPESPRWLVLQGRLGEAKRVLDKTSDSISDSHQRLSDIKAAVGIPLDYTDDVIQVPKTTSHGQGVWKELFLHPTPPVLHILISTIGIQFFQQASGIEAVVLYSPRIFEKAGITSSNGKLLATMAVGFSKTIFVLVATFLLDKIGRRSLLLISVTGKIISLMTLGFSLMIIEDTRDEVTWAVGLCIAMVILDVGFFSMGMGPIAWIYSSEIFPLKLRAQGASVGVMVNRVMSGIVGMTFISLYEAITISGAFFLFAGIATVSWLFFYFVLPETQGKTLEEIEGLFGNFSWKFSLSLKICNSDPHLLRLHQLPEMGSRRNINSGNVDFVPPPPKPKTKRNKFAFLCAILASMSSILLGYDTAVMSGAAIFIKEDFKISDVKVEVLVGIINIYSLIGAAAAGKTSDMIGRRYTMVVAGVIFFLAAILMGFATNYIFLMFGRFVAGIGVGYALMIAPVYTTEVSPTSARGFLTSFPEVFINSGVLLGYVSNFAFRKLPTHLGWRLMLGIGVVPSTFLILIALIMPESPRWLVLQGRLDEARQVLDKTSDSISDSHQRLADIKEAVGIPANCTDNIVQVPKHTSHGKGVWKELFLHPTPPVRHILISAIGIHFFQQASGIDAVVLYSPRIFEKAGITSSHDKLLATMAVGFSKTIFILVATFLLDKIGRRPLLLSSVTGKIISLTTLGSGLMIIERSKKKVTWAVGLCIAMVLTDVGFFSIGMGPIAWVYSSEIFPLKLRAQGVSVGVIVNRVVSGVIGMTFISLYKAITISGAFFLFAGIATVSWLFFYFVLPETQGRTLEEIEGLFGDFLWKFSSTKKNRGNSDNRIDKDKGQIQLESSSQA